MSKPTIRDCETPAAYPQANARAPSRVTPAPSQKSSGKLRSFPAGKRGHYPDHTPRNHAGSSGQSLVEFALLVPLLFLVIINMVNFGGFFFAWITVTNAARAGAQYMTMGPASRGQPAAPTAAQVTTLVTNDISSLLNRSSLVVRVCTNNNGTISCSGGGTSSPPADPEPSFYVLGSVDATYTYRPFISMWSFSRLGIYLTLPSSTIHQRSVMRMMQ